MAEGVRSVGGYTCCAVGGLDARSVLHAARCEIHLHERSNVQPAGDLAVHATRDQGVAQAAILHLTVHGWIHMSVMSSQCRRLSARTDLAGRKASGVDGLALREKVGVLASGSLCRLQKLYCSAGWRGCEVYSDDNLFKWLQPGYGHIKLAAQSLHR